MSAPHLACLTVACCCPPPRTLLANGPGLRRLTATTALWFSCNNLWSTQSAYRLGVLGLTTPQDSYFNAGYNIFGLASQKLCVIPFLQRCGRTNKQTTTLCIESDSSSRRLGIAAD
eukprot:SAG22_NODE_94_length_20824_cov_230.693718_4_plen_116_part_00